MAANILSSESPVLQSDISFKKTVQPEETIVNYSCEGLDMAPPPTAQTSACSSVLSHHLLVKSGRPIV